MKADKISLRLMRQMRQDYLEEEGWHGEGDLPQNENRRVAPRLMPLLTLPRRRPCLLSQHLDGAFHLVVDQVELQVGGVGARDL